MQIVYDMALSKDQIRQINLCRLAKHITFLSEILHHDGQTLSPTALIPNVQSHTNMYEIFPLIKAPDKHWTLWSNVLKTIKSSFTVQIHKIGKLIDPSRTRWLIPSDGRYVYQLAEKVYSIHRFSHTAKDGDFYHKAALFTTSIKSFFHLRWITPVCTTEYIKVSNKSRSNTFKSTGSSINIPHLRSTLSRFHTQIRRRLTHSARTNRLQRPQTNLTRPLPAPIARTATYEPTNHEAYRHWWETHWTIQPKPLTPSTTTETKEFNFTVPSEYDREFVDIINNLDPPLRRNVGLLIKIPHLPSLVQALESSKLIAVSDASMTDDAFCAHAYTIISNDEKHQLIGVAPVDCDEDDADSTRAEKAGI